MVSILSVAAPSLSFLPPSCCTVCCTYTKLIGCNLICAIYEHTTHIKTDTLICIMLTQQKYLYILYRKKCLCVYLIILKTFLYCSVHQPASIFKVIKVFCVTNTRSRPKRFFPLPYLIKFLFLFVTLFCLFFLPHDPLSFYRGIRMQTH